MGAGRQGLYPLARDGEGRIKEGQEDTWEEDLVVHSERESSPSQLEGAETGTEPAF